MRTRKVLESEGSNYTMLFFFIVLSAFFTISLPPVFVTSLEKEMLSVEFLPAGMGLLNINPLQWIFYLSDFLGYRIILILQTIILAWFISLVYNLLKKNFKDRELAVNTCFLVILCTPWLFLQAQYTTLLGESVLVLLIVFFISESMHEQSSSKILYSLIAFIILCLVSPWYLPLGFLYLYYYKRNFFSLQIAYKMLFILPVVFFALFILTGLLQMQTQTIIREDLVALANGPYIGLNHLIFAPFSFLVIAVPWFIKRHYLTKVLSKGKKSKKAGKEKEAPLILKRYLLLIFGSILLVGTYLNNPFSAVFMSLLLAAPLMGNVRFPAWSLIVPLIFFPFMIYIFINSESDFTFFRNLTIILYILSFIAAIILIRLINQEKPNRLYLNLALGIVCFLFINSFNYGIFYYYRMTARVKNQLQSDLYHLEEQAKISTSIVTDDYGEFFIHSLNNSLRENITINKNLSIIDNDFSPNWLLLLSQRTQYYLPGEQWDHTPKNHFQFYRLK